jgi:integrase/recombinase XerC
LDEKAMQLIPHQGDVLADFQQEKPQHNHMDLDVCIAGWINEKGGLSGSEKTTTAYTETLNDFRATLKKARKDLDSEPALVAPIAQGWAGQSKREGQQVTWSTYNQRLAVLSSFYEYAIRHEVLSYNPIERVKRRKKGAKNIAQPLSPVEVSKGLVKIDRSTLEGKRDYALLFLAVNVARRMSELAGLRYGDLHFQGNTTKIVWRRTKGGETISDVVEKKVTSALYEYLHALYGADLGRRSADDPVWISFSDRNAGKAISARTIQRLCEKYLGTSKSHTFRHTWAVAAHKQGATLSEIGRQLHHKNLKTTSDYMEEIQAQVNPYASKMEDLFSGITEEQQ